MAHYTKGNHEEIPDPTPVEMPIGYRPPETIQQLIARLVRYESDHAGERGQETFEEADDFDCDDDGELVSPYQMTNMQEEYAPPRERDGNGRQEREPDSVSAPKKRRGISASDEDEEAPEPAPKPARKASKKDKELVAEEA